MAFEKIKNFLGFGNSNENKNERDVISPVKDVDTMPKLVIDDLVLQVSLGQWLKILPSSYRQENASFSIILHLDASQLINRSRYFEDSKIKKKNLRETIVRMSKLLAMTGIKLSETCILENFNEKEFSFDCRYLSTGEIVHMSFIYGDMFEYGPELYIKDKKGERRYEYYTAYEKKPERLLLRSYTTKLGENDLKFDRYISEFTYYGHLSNNDYKVDVEIKYPEHLKDETINPYLDEELMEQHLNTLALPVNVDEVCRAVAASLLVDSNLFPFIKVTVAKKDGKNYKVTQCASFKNGEIVKFLIEIDGKVIELDDFNAWRHEAPDYTVIQDKDKKMNLEWKNFSLESTDQEFNPSLAINKAKQDVEEVKLLAKTILKKDNK